MIRRSISFLSVGLTMAAILTGSPVDVHAQSNVTLYGLVDTGILYASRTFDPKTGQVGGHTVSMIDGGTVGSFWGISGQEDIGGGTKAIFKLESGFSSNNGALWNSNGNFFGRQAYVGLTGKFGTLKVGEQMSPFVLSIINLEPRNGSYFGGDAPLYVGQLFVTGVYVANAVSYTSPEVAGLQGSAMIALGGAPGDFQAGLQYSARLRYQWSSLVVDAALFSGNEGGTASSTPFKSTVPFIGRNIGATYAWGSALFSVIYEEFKVSGSFDNHIYGVGAQYFIRPDLVVDTGVWYDRDGNDGSNNSLMAAAGLTKYFSKRTSLYTEVAYVKNRGLMHTGLSVNGPLYGPTGSSTGVVVGMRHVF
ncbi:MAG TPA: porin [Paraburkholderia sp.]|uniref:porin n=1 Tax=Paraburkholderia sp. TaxID=1926495 RepID=UPI002B48B5D6|nr:porin [Paraburkholderia sp.]HKR46940.1 porin [Paraburkholderia sp.]